MPFFELQMVLKRGKEMYNSIRNTILKRHPLIFELIRFLYTPIRQIKTFIIRRKAANKFLHKYSEIKKDDKKIFYFGIPEHNNLGDLAQTYCTIKWLQNNYPKYKILEVNTNVSFDMKFLSKLNKLLQYDDVFIFQSGYCTQKTHMDHWMHMNILHRFSSQKALILPQTVNLKEINDVTKAKKVFTDCKRLLFLARDHVSYDQAKCFTRKEQLVLFPDIVTTLIGNKWELLCDRKGIAICVRNDDEKFYSDDEINGLVTKLKQVSDRVDLTDTNSSEDVKTTIGNLEFYIREKINSFSEYQVIITDRYHGTIFSLVANTPVIIIKTNDHKVTSGYDWFKNIFDNYSIQMASDLESAYAMAKQIIQEEITINNSDYFLKNFYFTKLKNLFDSI